MAWWMWMILGFALAIAEAHVPTSFFLLAFGIGGVIVGALVALGWEGAPALQWLVFTVIAVIAAFVFNKTFSKTSTAKPFDSARERDNLIGEAAVVIADVPANGIGRAELRGTTWSARGSGGAALPNGLRCRVERVDGLTLLLRPE
jgi:membrane protein implicated in regulation of membrane protease activity